MTHLHYKHVLVRYGSFFLCQRCLSSQLALRRVKQNTTLTASITTISSCISSNMRCRIVVLLLTLLAQRFVRGDGVGRDKTSLPHGDDRRG